MYNFLFIYEVISSGFYVNSVVTIHAKNMMAFI